MAVGQESFHNDKRVCHSVFVDWLIALSPLVYVKRGACVFLLRWRRNGSLIPYTM